MKHLRMSRADRRSRRRARMARMRTLVGVLLAGFALLGIVFMYLLDYKRLRADLGRWLSEIDQAQRRTDTGSRGQPLP